MNLMIFIFTLTLTSTLIGLSLLTFASLFKRARYWPLFWGVGLIIAVSNAFLAFAFAQWSYLLPEIPIRTPPIHIELDALNWPALINVEFGQLPMFTGFKTVSKICEVVYFAGVILSLLRLCIGRYRAAKIAKASTRIKLPDGTLIGITDADIPCMTVTPFGRPRQSLIIMAKALRDKLSDTELMNVIRHEKGHITRRDDEVGLVLRVFVAMAWFNPILHMLLDRWIMAAELQCDQIALKGQSYRMRRAYVQTLLTALHIAADRVRPYPAASLSTQNLRNEKMRISQIMNGPVPIFKHIGHKLTLMMSAVGIALISAMIVSAPVIAEATQTRTPTTHPAATQTEETQPVLAVETSALKTPFTIDGEMTSVYGKVKDPFKKNAFRNHRGVDFKAPIGTPIYAPADGVVVAASSMDKYGKVVVFQTRENVQTLLAHLDSYAVHTGQKFTQGQKLAEIGSSGKSTGSHVHIETRQNGVRVDPMSVWRFSK